VFRLFPALQISNEFLRLAFFSLVPQIIIVQAEVETEDAQAQFIVYCYAFPTSSYAPFAKLRTLLISRHTPLPAQPLVKVVQERADALVIVRVQFQRL